jgi:hypothetical protein
MEDITFLAPLEFTIEIRALDTGVSVHFEDLITKILYEWIPHDIRISAIEREFKSELEPLDPDDIRPVEHDSIDLSPILREEIIMAIHTL